MQAFIYTTITLYGQPSQIVQLHSHTHPACWRPGTRTRIPQPHTRNPRQVITRTWFSHHPLSLATTNGISLPAGTKMFHFPAFPPATYLTQPLATRHYPGQVSPFGNPRIKRSLANSPRHIAGRHVLHQLLMPRHPPNALYN